MYTQCPQCQTVFRVGATLLKAAKGRVRCGRCSHVFDALTFLIEAEEPPAAPAPEPPPAEIALKVPASEPSPEYPSEADGEIDLTGQDIPESALEFTADDLSQVFVVEQSPTLVRTTPAGAPAPASSATAPGSFAEISSDDDTAEHEILDIELTTSEGGEFITLEGDSVVLADDDPSITPESFGEGATPATAGSALSGEIALPAAGSTTSSGITLQTSDTTVVNARNADAIDDEVRREIESAFAADPTTRAEFTLPSGKRLDLRTPVAVVEAADDAADTMQAERERDRRATLGWSIASGGLALLLCVQAIHHNRQALARTSAFGSAISSIYSGLGSDVDPAWNVRAYELRQFGATADASAGGTLRVKASLLNGAVHAQPYPVLRLTLQDRFGGQVGLRDVEPREYLQGSPATGALIGAGQRVDANIAIVDPGRDAVGFEIDVCLRTRPDRLTCANDLEHAG